MKQLLKAAGATVICWAVLGVGPAAGGEYPVRVCTAAHTEGFRSDALILTRSNDDMWIQRDCQPHGPGDGGVITRNRSSSGKARFKSVAYAI